MGCVTRGYLKPTGNRKLSPMPLTVAPRPAALARILAAVLILSLGVALAPAPASAAASGGTDVIFPATNKHRAAKKVANLKWSAGLSSVAEAWSKKMLSSQKMAHNPKYGSQIPQKGLSAWGENVAYACGHGGQAANAKVIMTAWKKSSGHNKNMLSKTFTHIGVGTAYDKKSDCLYATQNFGKYPKAAAASFYRAPAPTITGTAKVGSTLALKRGTWSPTTGVKFTYRWYANGKAITGAKGAKYKITSGAAGKRITVKVTAKKSGLSSVTTTSATTAVVKKK